MSTETRLIRNTTFLTVGDKTGYLLQLVFFLYFAQQFGVIPVGEYSFAFFFTYAFAMLADSGVSTYLVREVARNKTNDRQLFVDCLILRVVALAIVTLIAIFAIKIFFQDISSRKANVLVCWGIYWIFNQIADIFLAELNGHEKMGRVAFLGVLSKLMSAVIGVSLIYFEYPYDLVMIAFPVSNFFYMIACVIVSKITLGSIQLKFRIFSFYKKFFIELLPFFFSVILVELINCQDILILGFVQDDRSVGIYSSGIKLVTFIVGISAFIQIAIAPVLSRLFFESKEKLVEISRKILRYLVLTSLPLSFGLVLTADRIIEILYTDAFQQASIVIKIAGWSISAAFIQCIFSALLTAINRQKEKVIFISITFFITTILNFVLIHYLDIIGASIVKLITISLSLIFFVYLVQRYLKGLLMIGVFIKSIAGCLCMSLIIYFFNNLNLFLLICIAAIVYICVLFISGTFSSEELRFVKSLIPLRLSLKDKQ